VGENSTTGELYGKSLQTFQTAEISTFWLWRKAQGINCLNDVQQLTGKGRASYQKLIWRTNDAKIFLYLHVSM